LLPPSSWCLWHHLWHAQARRRPGPRCCQRPPPRHHRLCPGGPRRPLYRRPLYRRRLHPSSTSTADALPPPGDCASEAAYYSCLQQACSCSCPATRAPGRSASSTFQHGPLSTSLCQERSFGSYWCCFHSVSRQFPRHGNPWKNRLPAASPCLAYRGLVSPTAVLSRCPC